MGKHVQLKAPKASPKPGPRGAPRPETPLQESTARLALVAPLFEQMVGAVQTALDKGEANSATIRETSGLIRAATAFSREQRALASAMASEEERKTGNMLDRITIDIAVRFINELPERERWRAIQRMRGEISTSRRTGVLG